MFKTIVKGWMESCRFNTQMRMLGRLDKRTKTQRVKITKQQMDILLYCAQRGIDSRRGLHMAVS